MAWRSRSLPSARAGGRTIQHVTAPVHDELSGHGALTLGRRTPAPPFIQARAWRRRWPLRAADRRRTPATTPAVTADDRHAWIGAVSPSLLPVHRCRSGRTSDRAPPDASTSSVAECDARRSRRSLVTETRGEFGAGLDNCVPYRALAVGGCGAPTPPQLLVRPHIRHRARQASRSCCWRRLRARGRGCAVRAGALSRRSGGG